MGDVELRFYEILIREEIENLCENGRFLQMASYIQHGDISVFEHSVGVAYTPAFLPGFPVFFSESDWIPSAGESESSLRDNPLDPHSELV